jgi:hypothetical protein
MTTYTSRQLYEATLEDIDELDKNDIKNLERIGVNDSNINGLNSLPYLTADDKKDLIDFIQTKQKNNEVNMDVNHAIENLVIDVKSRIKHPATFTDRNKLSRQFFNTIVDNYTTSINQLTLQRMKDARVEKDKFDNRKSDTPAIHQSSLLHLLRGNKYKKRSRKSRHLRGGSKKIKRRASNKSRQRRHKTNRK